MRDYRQELDSLGRLYAPAYVSNADKGLTMTEYGAPTEEPALSLVQQQISRFKV